MNNKIAFLFSGQGSQYVGMGKDIYDTIPECRKIFDDGEKILGFKINDIIFNGPQELLTQTENTQPAILLTSLACLKALEINGIESECVSGLSLGEYTALIYGGALSFEDGVKLIKERGRIMGSSQYKGLGGMAAILKLNEEKIELLLEKAREFGVIEGANFNCPGQVVIAGEMKAINETVKIAKELGGMSIPLKVSGPFHSSLLEGASFEFFEHLKSSEVKTLNKIVYSNVNGVPYKENDDVKTLLRKQIMSSVLFEKTIRDMLDRGINTFIEVGPGKVLSGFVKKIERSAKVLNVENLSSLEDTIKELKQSI